MTTMILATWDKANLACADCGARPDYSNPPYSLSDVWIVECENLARDCDQMFCVCIDCAVFYQQSPHCRVAPLTSYRWQIDKRRLKDLILDGHSFNKLGVVMRYMWALKEEHYLKRAAQRPARPPSSPRTIGSRRPIPARLRYQILQRDGFRCQACGRSPAVHEVVLHVDHIVPVVKGGTNDPSNLQALCADCNLGKSDQ
jgi:5-methylcytosine-specific restriction endonuclease McrA